MPPQFQEQANTVILQNLKYKQVLFTYYNKKLLVKNKYLELEDFKNL